MKLKTRHLEALHAAKTEPIYGVPMGQRADPALRRFNYSTICLLLKYGLLWRKPGEPSRYLLTRKGFFELNEDR